MTKKNSTRPGRNALLQARQRIAGYSLLRAKARLQTMSPSQSPGGHKDEPGSHFYMCDFYSMTDDLPDISKLCAVVARIHLDTMGKSPNGQYGFHVTTHLAYVDNNNSWSYSWEQWYARALKRMLQEEEKSHGPDDELKALTNAMFEKVVPRLLRPLEAGGRQIKPCLVHSDLWPGNVKPDAKTDEPIIFDSVLFGVIMRFGDGLLTMFQANVMQPILVPGGLRVTDLDVHICRSTIGISGYRLQQKTGTTVTPCRQCR
ncbi:MAG: hypothetical protein Q9178_008019 [Gyalolechia marmorata]